MPAKNGDTVLVHYIGTLADGTMFDSSRDGEPLESVLGQGMLIPGFENAILGMEVGESKTVDIEPDQAYGQRLEELMILLPKEEIPAHMSPEVGMLVQLSTEEGEEFEAMIAEVTEEGLILDANHPLAGEALTFELELMQVNT